MSFRSLNGLNSSIRSLNGLEGIGIENVVAGDAISVVSTSGTRTINLLISKQVANDGIGDADVFVLEEADGTVKKITGANLKAGTVSSNWTLSSGNLYPLATGTDVIIGATAQVLSPDQKLYVNGASQFSGVLTVYGDPSTFGYINFYNADKTNHFSLNPPATMVGSGYDVFLPNDGGNLCLTTGSSSLTTVGTIATGVWEGTTVAVNAGGSGQTSYVNGQLLIGNTTGNTLTKATLTASTNVTITNGAGSISIASTDTNTTYLGGTNITLSGTTFNLDAGLSGLTSIGMSALLQGTGYGIAGFNLLNGTFYSAGSDNEQQQIYLLNQNTNYGFTHNNYFQGGGGSAPTSDIATYVDNTQSAIGNTHDQAFTLYTNNANVFKISNVANNNWCMIGKGIGTSNAGAPLHIQTPSTLSSGCTVFLDSQHATANSRIIMKTNAGSVDAYLATLLLEGSTSNLQFRVGPLDTVGLKVINTGDAGQKFGHDGVHFYYDGSAYSYWYNPSGYDPTGAASTANSFQLYHNNGTVLKFNCPSDYDSGLQNYFSFASMGTQKARITGDGNATICGAWTGGACPSDIRLKSNIQDVNNATALLMVLKVKSFNKTALDNFDDDENGKLKPFLQRLSNKSHYDIGLIAQDVVKTPLKFLVKGGDFGLIEPASIPNWNPLTALCIKAIQEQQAEIDSLKEIVNKLINSKSFKEFKSTK
jgi:hypothetical protein